MAWEIHENHRSYRGPEGSIQLREVDDLWLIEAVVVRGEPHPLFELALGELDSGSRLSAYTGRVCPAGPRIGRFWSIWAEERNELAWDGPTVTVP